MAITIEATVGNGLSSLKLESNTFVGKAPVYMQNGDTVSLINPGETEPEVTIIFNGVSDISYLRETKSFNTTLGWLLTVSILLNIWQLFL